MSHSFQDSNTELPLYHPPTLPPSPTIGVKNSFHVLSINISIYIIKSNCSRSMKMYDLYKQSMLQSSQVKPSNFANGRFVKFLIKREPSYRRISYAWHVLQIFAHDRAIHNLILTIADLTNSCLQQISQIDPCHGESDKFPLVTDSSSYTIVGP